jgi:Zn-dependent protease with chaperone function
MKIRYLSPSKDSKTGTAYKLCFMIGIFLLIVVVLLKLIALIMPNNNEGVIGSLVSVGSGSFIDIGLAFIILLFGIGGILLFFHKQFEKLADAIEDMENEKI